MKEKRKIYRESDESFDYTHVKFPENDNFMEIIETDDNIYYLVSPEFESLN